MSERIKREAVDPLTPAGTDDVEFPVPAGFDRVFLQLLFPDGGGGANQSSYEIFFLVDGGFRATNPATSGGPVPFNVSEVVSIADAPPRLRVRLTNGAVPSDGGAVVELHGVRSAG